MADDLNIDISSIFGDTIDTISDFLTGDSKKNTKKTAAAKKTSTAKKTTTAKKTSTAKKTTTTKKTSTAKKSTTTKKTTSSKSKKIIFEIGGRQIDMKTIEKKAAKLSGDVYVVANERKIYDSEGNSINLFG
ncbi:MAG: hypothetical protein J6X33_05040 [Clostridiales bacterium]|nr:hypothetical protein [Clostridiales bacterium]